MRSPKVSLTQPSRKKLSISSKDFGHFQHLNLLGPLINGLQYFQLWLRFCGLEFEVKTDLPGYPIPETYVFADFLLTRWGMILWEDDSPGYYNPRRFSHRGIIPKGD